MSASVRQTIAIELTIPDNAAFTALETLRRIGLKIGALRRADIWVFDVDAAVAADVPATLRGIETIYNPNKHVLVERAQSQPLAGEVWIADRDHVDHPLSGRPILGVADIERRTAWQLFDEFGHSIDPAVLDTAVETFLCNPAFQRAIR